MPNADVPALEAIECNRHKLLESLRQRVSMEDAALEDVLELVRGYAEIATPDALCGMKCRRTEERLRQRERELTTLLENIPDIIVRYDRHCRRTFVSPSYVVATGLAPGLVLGKTPREGPWRMSCSAAEFEQRILRVLHSGEPDEILLERGSMRDDGYRCYALRAVAEYDADGQALGVLTLGQDVTDRKRGEAVLQFTAQRGWAAGGESFLTALARYFGETLGVDYVVVDKLADEPGFAETVALYARGAIVPNLRYPLQGTPCENVLSKRLCCYPRDIQALFPEDALLVEMKVESYVGIPLWDAAGKAIGLIAVMDGKPMDETAPSIVNLLQLVATRAAAELEQQRWEAALTAREREFRTLTENSPDGIARFDRECRCVYANPRLTAWAGVPLERLLGKTPRDFPGRVEVTVFQARIVHVLITGDHCGFEMRVQNSDGVKVCADIRLIPEFDADGRVLSVLAVGRDISEIDAYRKDIQHLAFFDPLTELPNRALLFDRIGQTIADAAWHGHQFGLMLLDLDHFKTLNDALGHSVGDQLLRSVAERL